jgi:hypothetical protein
MIRRSASVLILIAFTAIPAAAQGRGNGRNTVPPGHLPSAGECRVWYDGVPAGRQPAPMNCRDAERIAARQPNARVIYGNGASRSSRDYPWGRDDDRYGRDDRYGHDDRYGRDGRYDPDGRRPRRGAETQGRAVPRTDGYPSSYPYPDNRYPSPRGDFGSVPFQNGYEDGVVKGREDARDRDRFDPARHSWYRSASRGYNSRYGSRQQYADAYRQGFLRGYEETYHGVRP